MSNPMPVSGLTPGRRDHDLTDPELTDLINRGRTDRDLTETERTNARLAAAPTATRGRTGMAAGTGATTGMAAGTGAAAAGGTTATTATATGTATGARAAGAGTQARREAADQSIGSLIAEVADDVSRLFRQEVELAKAELKAEASKAGKAAGMLGGAGFAGYMVALFASLTLMFALAAIMPTGWAALIVTALWGIAGAVLFVMGRKRIRTVSPMPHQTVETLKEDAEWLRHPTR